jgi:Arc/MetJ-type ribon-helix-helix transcriptional regulator
VWAVPKLVARVTVRLDQEMAEMLDDFARFLGVKKSEYIRYAILFTRVLHDPELKLGDALKEHYVELLKRDPEAVLKMPLIDVLKPLKRLEAFIKLVESAD